MGRLGHRRRAALLRRGCLFAWKAQVQHRELEEAAAAEAARSKKRGKKGRR